MRFFPFVMRLFLLSAWLVCATTAATAAPPASTSVYMEELTSTELQTRLTQGCTTVLLPIGGTEQNGPHMVLGKHNVRVRALAAHIAQQLGTAVVAPVLAYVPEGSITPPAAHMRFSGTLSISEAAFEAVLDGAARSLRQHGFRDIVLLGDHGGYRASLARVAQRLNREWAKDASTRVYPLPEYYAAAQQPFTQILRDKGYTASEIGVHAGLADTALALAVDPGLVRTDQLAQAAAQAPTNGVTGDPRRASAALGQPGLQYIVNTSVTAIRAAIATR